MADIPVMKEDGLQEPAIGDKAEHKTEKKEIKEDKLSDREKELIETKKNNMFQVSQGNTELVMVKLLEQISISNQKILKQLIEMNYYMAKSVGEADIIKESV